MPTYEYECESCGYRFERFQSITAEPIKQCPICGGEVKRLIGVGSGIIFKGTGFYATDYRSPRSAEAKPKIERPKREKNEPQTRLPKRSGGQGTQRGKEEKES
ncbi:MAG: FmdB family zinc ribbon protein [Candidatus Edwardsbacteria bacterium]